MQTKVYKKKYLCYPNVFINLLRKEEVLFLFLSLQSPPLSLYLLFPHSLQTLLKVFLVFFLFFLLLHSLFNGGDKVEIGFAGTAEREPFLSRV